MIEFMTSAEKQIEEFRLRAQKLSLAQSRPFWAALLVTTH